MRIEANLIIKNLLSFLNSHYQSSSPIKSYLFNNFKINIIKMNKLIKFEINGLALLLEMESVSISQGTRLLLSLQGLGNEDFSPTKKDF